MKQSDLKSENIINFDRKNNLKNKFKEKNRSSSFILLPILKKKSNSIEILHLNKINSSINFKKYFKT